MATHHLDDTRGDSIEVRYGVARRVLHGHTLSAHVAREELVEGSPGAVGLALPLALRQFIVSAPGLLDGVVGACVAKRFAPTAVARDWR